MVSTNQRSIHEGIHRVTGSANRGFASMDPERQPRIVTQAGQATPAQGRQAAAGGIGKAGKAAPGAPGAGGR